MRKFSKVATLVSGTLAVFAVNAASAYAQGTIPEIGPSGETDTGFDLANFFQNGVQTAVNVVFFLAMAAAIGYLVWAGIKYITAGGDPKKAEAARTAIINAVIGVAVIAGAYTLINIAFGINNTANDLAEEAVTFQPE